MFNIQAIEDGRQTQRGRLDKQDDLEWEAYLQIHESAERLGLLTYDNKLHNYLNEKLAMFEDKYNVSIE